MSGAKAEPRLAPQVVGVMGNHMTLDGSAWLPRGVTLQAFTAPIAFQQANYPATFNARQHYGIDELAAARAFGVDTLRFQVSQPSLDSQSPLYDATYMQNLIAAIRFARWNGFVVLIMMQDEALSGDPTRHPLATAETLRDWEMLTTYFGADRGILFELYNEPEPPETPANWALWAHGDWAHDSTVAPGAIGMQAIINRLRTLNSQNVVVLDGLRSAHTLNGVPVITDPLNRVVYAVHPYFNGSDDESHWDEDFGNLSRTLPVFADEWSAKAGNGPLGLGQLPTYQVAVDFLNYLRRHFIPLSAGAFDIAGLMVQQVPGWTPTNYDDYSPSNTKDDAGQLVHVLFRSNYYRPLTLQDGLSPQ